MCYVGDILKQFIKGSYLFLWRYCMPWSAAVYGMLKIMIAMVVYPKFDDIDEIAFLWMLHFGSIVWKQIWFAKYDSFWWLHLLQTFVSNIIRHVEKAWNR